MGIFKIVQIFVRKAQIRPYLTISGPYQTISDQTISGQQLLQVTEFNNFLIKITLVQRCIEIPVMHL